MISVQFIINETNCSLESANFTHYSSAIGAHFRSSIFQRVCIDTVTITWAAYKAECALWTLYIDCCLTFSGNSWVLSWYSDRGLIEWLEELLYKLNAISLLFGLVSDLSVFTSISVAKTKSFSGSESHCSVVFDECYVCQQLRAMWVSVLWVSAVWFLIDSLLIAKYTSLPCCMLHSWRVIVYQVFS